jgi:hypothetical protein
MAAVSVFQSVAASAVARQVCPENGRSASTLPGRSGRQTGKAMEREMMANPPRARAGLRLKGRQLLGRRLPVRLLQGKNMLSEVAYTRLQSKMVHIKAGIEVTSRG